VPIGATLRPATNWAVSYHSRILNCGTLTRPLRACPTGGNLLGAQSEGAR
jgi:hypothetical protein